MVRRESPHGTASRARMHYADGEKPCPDCRQAQNRYYTDWRSRNRDLVNQRLRAVRRAKREAA